MNGIEGQAHVEVDDDNTRWCGYILIPPQTRKYAYFWSAMKTVKEVIYEGPVLYQGKYYFGSGATRIQKVKDSGPDLRVDFSSDIEFHIAGSLEEQPADFIFD